MELQPPIRFQLTTDNKRIPSASNYIQASFQLSAIEQQQSLLSVQILLLLLFNFHIALPYAAATVLSVTDYYSMLPLPPPYKINVVKY